MKTHIFILSALAALLFLASCKQETNIDPNKAPEVTLANASDTLSWVLGEAMGRQFAMVKEINQLTVDDKLVQQAFATAVRGQQSPIDPTISEQIYNRFSVRASQNQHQAQQNQATTAANKEEDYFNQLVKERPQVKKHKSGIYYEITREGNGRKAKIGDVVKFDYRGYNLFTGEVFDQTYGNREPLVHVVGSPMFQGLIDGLQLMNAGSLYRLYIPNELAFGANGTANIPPYTPVIYDIELHDINPQ